MTRWGATLSILLVALVASAPANVAGSPGAETSPSAGSSPCREARVGRGYQRRIARVLRQRSDVWGRRLVRSASGPTYERISRLLPPLLLARAASGRFLTESGVHYTPFSQPTGAKGATSVALHVADGSQIVSRRARGRRLTISVGRYGRERYGSCSARSGLPRLADGYLPILETRYVDEQGVRYTQESFAVHVPETSSLVSFVRLSADASGLEDGVVRIRFTPSAPGLVRGGTRLVRRRRTWAFFEEGARVVPGSVAYVVPAGTEQTVYAAWLNTPGESRPIVLDEARYEEAREAVQTYWERRLSRGGLVIVPEQRVLDAERNLLIQNLAMTWRYSLGNHYEQLSTPEAVDVARVLAEYGQHAVSRTVLSATLRAKGAPSLDPSRRRTSWRAGARLVGIASYVRLTGDLYTLARVTPTARAYVARLRHGLRVGRYGLLPRERFSSDVAARVYGLHSQAVAWQGLRDMSEVWRSAGYTQLADESAAAASQLGRGLRRAVRRSARRLPDGALFVPIRLLERERPYRSVTASRDGSYWNLVMPFALASGLFPPGGVQAHGVLRYLDTHGARMLGLVRSRADSLYGRDASRGQESGVSPVYGLSLARFLADNDRADDLVLGLYAQLAVTLAPGTFVSGESVSVAPLAGRLYRAAYLPPNSASSAAFLETLRSLVVHERSSGAGVPTGLDLAFATPRSWLQPGRAIEVRRMATSFGPVSYTLSAEQSAVHASITVPSRAPLRTLRLRLRLPGARRVTSVLVDGVAYRGRLDRPLALPTSPGTHEVEASTG